LLYFANEGIREQWIEKALRLNYHPDITAKYKIMNEIGKGAFGVVYKGMNLFTYEEVAIKKVHKSEERSQRHSISIEIEC